MRTTLHILFHDIRSLWWLILLHIAGLAWRFVDLLGSEHPFYWGFGYSHLWATIALELLGMLLIGFAVLEDSPRSRRAFWRRLPIPRLHLLSAKLLFATLFAFLPRVLVQVLYLETLGLTGELFLWAALDITASQGFWMVLVLALASLCRRPTQLGLAFFAVVFSLLVKGFLGNIVNASADFDVRIRFLGQILFNMSLLIASLYFLIQLYRHLRIRHSTWVPTIILLLVALIVALMVPEQIIKSEDPEVVTVPQDLEFDVEFAGLRHFRSDSKPMILLRLIPKNLPSHLGVETYGIDGTFNTTDGQELLLTPIKSELPCLASMDFQKSLANPERLEGCATQLVFPWSKLDPEGNWRELEGILKLRVRMTVFQENKESLPLRRGASFTQGLESTVVYKIEATEKTTVTVFRFVPQQDKVDMSRTDYFHDLYFWNSESLRLGQKEEWDGWSPFVGVPFPLPYMRVQIAEIKQTLVPEVGFSESGNDLLFLRHIKSRSFTKEITVENFRLEEPAAF